MSFEELKPRLREEQKKSVEISKRIQQAEQSCRSLEEELSDLDFKIMDSVRQEKLNTQRVWVESETRDIVRQLGEVKSERSELELVHSKEIEECDEELIYSELREKEGIPEDIDETMGSLKSSIVEDIGERFYEEYLQQLDSYSVELTNAQLGQVVRRFNSMQEEVERLSTKDNLELIDKFSDVLDNVSRGKVENNAKGALKFAGVIGLALLLVSKIVFPLYSIFLAFRVGTNIKKNTVFSQAMLQYKIVRDNLERIETMLRDKARKEKERIISELEEDFKVSSKKLDDEIVRLDNLLEETRLSAMNSFEFDEEAAKNKYMPAKMDLENKLKSYKKDIVRLTAEKEGIMSRIQEINEKLKDSVKSLQDTYLDFSKIGEDLIFNPEFLIDIVNDNPVMFTHPEASSLMLYDDTESVDDFCKLLIAQTRIRLNPVSQAIQVWDIRRMGISFISFYEKTNDLFKACTTKEDIKTSIEDLSEQMQKRVEMILKAYPSIGEYNRHMIELESVTESYYFIYVLDPDKSLFNDPVLSQLLTLGSKVGIYFMVFCNKEELTNEYLELFKKLDKFYEFTGDKLMSRAQLYVLDYLTKFGEQNLKR